MTKRKYKISKARILQISNDISEEMCTATPEELIEVALYFRDQYDELFQKLQVHRAKAANKLLKLSVHFLKPWC